MSSQHKRGAQLEAKIASLLQLLSSKHPKRVKVYTHPRLLLQNSEIVIPDFDLQVRLLHETTLTLVECQHRERRSKSILHKIQHIRQKSERKSFILVHTRPIGEEMQRALDAEGINHFLPSEFQEYLGFVSAELYASTASPYTSSDYKKAPTRFMGVLVLDKDFLEQ